jgi:hypothetical protein
MFGISIDTGTRIDLFQEKKMRIQKILGTNNVPVLFARKNEGKHI